MNICTFLLNFLFKFWKITLNNVLRNVIICNTIRCDFLLRVVLCVLSVLSDRQVSQGTYLIILFLVVQGFSPTAKLSWISLQFYVLVFHSFHVCRVRIFFSQLYLCSTTILLSENSSCILIENCYTNILTLRKLLLIKNLIAITQSIIAILIC